ncbi:flagellar biosynthetic protein FliQ [Alkalibacillus filiformis]|uniref:Flagellar biosynthetic protein FliQ n=2 Tax=Alkalibacillus TaxID=331654 RepID=A0A511W6F9_9BACI|nr:MULTISPECIES: flagellar biosynthesis protein FliQ [Alkalibacillus]MDQ0350635.1 flagellar biosynthetic protein FliQ [Alkalibacillus filiformis]MDV2580614.1 flagellar biosynthesis protein FliQ [Alkalibacillus haloalkaliphilus]GEN44932.1 flagellar biosynthetic protein FliQ [Alkalibacillus haloalkaliphilus]
MTPDMVVSLAERGIYTILIVVGPLLLIALFVGLTVAIFQATTQIQEQTLAFIPKIVAVFVGIVILGPWMLQRMIEFTVSIFNNISQVVG